MEQRTVPVGFTADSRFIRFSQLHDAFTQTVYGETLAQRTRWDRFKDEYTPIPAERWHKLFGPDVNNLEHMRLVYGQTGVFLNYCMDPPPTWTKPVTEEATFDEREQMLMRLYAIGHDWQEAITGDIMHDLKTDADRDEEARQFQVLITDVFGGEDNQELLALIKEAEHEVENKTTKLGKAFNAIERVGFLTTGMRAWKQSYDPANEDIETALIWMASNAMGNQLPPLVEYARVYPPVDLFLRNNADLIEDILTHVPGDIFNNYTNEEERGKQVQRFTNAQQVWQKTKTMM